VVDDMTGFVEEMNLQQALGGIRALGEGATTFLRALQYVELTVHDKKSVEVVDHAIAAQPDSYVMRLFKEAVRLLREGSGDPLSITLDAQAVSHEKAKLHEVNAVNEVLP
jgi:hypothetical protein